MKTSIGTGQRESIIIFEVPTILRLNLSHTTFDRKASTILAQQRSNSSFRTEVNYYETKELIILEQRMKGYFRTYVNYFGRKASRQRISSYFRRQRERLNSFLFLVNRTSVLPPVGFFQLWSGGTVQAFPSFFFTVHNSSRYSFFEQSQSRHWVSVLPSATCVTVIAHLHPRNHRCIIICLSGFTVYHFIKLINN